MDCAAHLYLLHREATNFISTNTMVFVYGWGLMPQMQQQQQQEEKSTFTSASKEFKWSWPRNDIKNTPKKLGKSRSVDQSFLPPFDLDLLNRVRNEQDGGRTSSDPRLESFPESPPEIPLSGLQEEQGEAEQAAILVLENGQKSPISKDPGDGSKQADMKARAPLNTVTYTVQRSDTLNSVAARFDTTPSELVKLNRLASRLIFPGQTLVVPEKTDETEGEVPPLSPLPVMANREDEASILDSIKPPSPKVLEKARTPLNSDSRFSDSGSTDESEDRVLDRECYERFLKINVRHITDGLGVVSGVLLVTPNAVMFDPNVSDPLVIELGPEAYGLIAPMEFVANAALYFDIAHMKVRHVPEMPQQFDLGKPEIYCGQMHPDILDETTEAESKADPVACEQAVATAATSSSPGKDSLLVKDETFPELAHHRYSPDADELGSVRDEGNAFPKAFERDLVTPTPTSAPTPTPFEVEVASDQSSDGLTGLPDSFFFGETPGILEAVNPAFVQVQSLELDGGTVGESSDAGVPEDKEKFTAEKKISESSDSPAILETESSAEVEKRPPTPGQKVLKHLTHPLTWMESFSGDRTVSESSASPEVQSSSVFTKVFSSSPTDGLVNFASKICGQETDGEHTGRRRSDFLLSLTNGTGHSKSNGTDRRLSSPGQLNSWVMIEPSAVDTLPKSRDPLLSTKEPAGPGFLQSKSPSKSQDVSKLGYRSMVSVDDMPELFASFDKLIPRPARRCDDPPLYLCLRMGKPVDKKISRSAPIMSYGKKMVCPEYWFSIPRDRVNELYKFFLLWVPHLYGEVDKEALDKRGFELLEEDTELWDEETDGATGSRANGEGIRIGVGELTKESWEMIKAPYAKLYNIIRSQTLISSECDSTEVVSVGEDLRRALYGSSIGSSIDLDLLLPEMFGESKMLMDEHRRQLAKVLPPRAQGYAWKQMFSTDIHGFSLSSLYRKNSQVESPVILVLQDTQSNVFGAFCASLRVSDSFYGTGESFLFTFCPEFRVYKWSGENIYFVKGNNNSLAIGSGNGQFGLWVDGDLNVGRTQACSTFANEPLVPEGDFIIKSLECWSFV